ncbi:DUF881 domain-containing protein [Sporosarcina ureilytica]|nr:DUF881 domain-containing protein [Sporosarcina ureilytica]
MRRVSSFFDKRGRPILFAIVFLVLGFILAFSYRTFGKDAQHDQLSSSAFLAEEKYRGELIEQQERNRELSDDIGVKQEEIRAYERSFLEQEEDHADLVEEAKDLRLLLGVVPAMGQGLRVTLKDAEYDPIEQNPNDYIVHESHIFKVINELRISGAQGISINGQRITHNSYIKCTGPVITVDGRTFPAPFVIEAVGKMDVLHEALYLKGGVVDRLLLDNIVVTTEQIKNLQLAAVGEES